MGRSGHLYAYQALGVTPDVLTSAKALGGGFPIGAMLVSDKCAPSLGFGTHGSTYGGNPLGCAVANEVIDIVNTPEVLNGVSEKADRLIAGLNKINAKHGIIKEIRNSGLLIGAELIEAWHGKAGEFNKAAHANGLMMLVAGPNVLRMTPSLIITDEEIDAGLAILEKAVDQVMAG